MMKARLKLLILPALVFCGCSSTGPGKYTGYVDPFIGTGAHGHTYPGVSLPFGMVQLSPDTRLTGWDGCSGYHYSDDIVYGFSHTHLSGTGISDYGDILLMPTVGDVVVNNGADGNPGYSSIFSHSREEASPGYYGVHLEDYGIDVELTATLRAGLHRYTFPRTQSANVILDLTHRDQVIESAIRFTDDYRIEGYRRSRQWARDQRVYFVIEFSRPFSSFGMVVDDEVIEGAGNASGTNLKAYVSFKTERKERVLAKVGISAVSIEGASKNLDAEMPGWDFDMVRVEAERAWNSELGRIEVKGGTRSQRTVFYTALYHSFLSPNLYMDVDGRYRGRDMEVHQTGDYINYTVFSLWDTFRAAHPLFTILQQRRTVDFIKTFLAQYEQGGLLPVWELAANETGTMIGYHSVSVIADAWLKGIGGYDIEKAFEAMKASAEQDHEGLGPYREYGYIPGTEESESVSKTLEYAYDDWCIAQVAKELGRMDDYSHYIRRAQYYMNIYDESSGFMRPKLNGLWLDPFDPREVNFHFTEANSWQYSFFVPHDVEGLMDLMGGRDAFTKKIDDLFTADSRTTGRNQSDITGLIGQYAHGNEPSHHMAYLYNFAGQPWQTQKRVREILDRLYSDRPEGLSGNEDCGQMSAWYVLSAAGFYPVCPGRPEYVIGTPLFPEVTIHLENGEEFVIRAENISGGNCYIQSATLNGTRYMRSYLEHEKIMQGGELVFRMDDAPNLEWGNGEDDLPQSNITDFPIMPVPYMATGERIFSGSTEVSLAIPGGRGEIYFTMDGSRPTRHSQRYTTPFTITETNTINAIAYLDELPLSHVITTTYHKIPENITIRLNNRYSDQYPASGEMALIDGIRGPTNFRTGSWQGYYGVDLDVVIDLGKPQTVSEVSTGFLQEIYSWIFLPSEVEYAISIEGEKYTVVGTVDNDVPQERGGVVLKDFTLRLTDKRARYMRVRARNIGECPPWHVGAGRKAWIFADEIVIR